jgi:hypothetical protein
MSVALTYYLKRQCGNIRPFCRSCVNSFKVNTCKSTCPTGPTTICLAPKIPGGISGPCDTCGAGRAAAAYAAIVTLADGSTHGPFILTHEDLNDGCKVSASFEDQSDPVLELPPNSIGVSFLNAAYSHTRAGSPMISYVFAVDTDIFVSPGCNQILTFTCSGIWVNLDDPIAPGDGTTMTIYPIATDTTP